MIKVGTKRTMFGKIGGWITGFSAGTSFALSAAFLFLLAIFITAHVILRTAGLKTFGFHEITLLMMVAFVLTGLNYTQRRKGHIRIDVLTSRLSPKAQEVLNCLALFLGLGYSVLFMWQLVILTHSFWVRGTFYIGMVPLPYWPSYVVACLGFAFFMIILIVMVIV